MVKKTVAVQNVNGLDMQTAAVVAENSGRFQADIFLQQGSMKANAKSVMGVMMLAARRSSELTIITDGEDEEIAMGRIESLLTEAFEVEATSS